MSNSFYANGNTGIVAIMSGGIDSNVINNPQDNTDKLYFHSGMDYLKYVGQITKSLPLPSVAQSQTLDTNSIVGTVEGIEGDPIFILFPIVDTVEAQGHFLVQSRTDNLYVRYLGVHYTLIGGTLTIYANTRGYCVYSGGMPAKTVSIIVDIYSTAPIEKSGIDITETTCKFGKFSSDNNYLSLAVSGYRLLQGNPYTFTGTNGSPTFSPTTTAAIEVDI